MTNLSNELQAETVAYEYLAHEGYKIIDRNWRLPQCEIDIIAQKGKTIYFVEVKYRKTEHQGAGLDYITSKKINQMHFAAENWILRNSWKHDYCLAALEVSGQQYEVTAFLTDVT